MIAFRSTAFALGVALGLAFAFAFAAHAAAAGFADVLDTPAQISPLASRSLCRRSRGAAIASSRQGSEDTSSCRSTAERPEAGAGAGQLGSHRRLLRR
jgi:hypothetical protein